MNLNKSLINEIGKHLSERMQKIIFTTGMFLVSFPMVSAYSLSVPIFDLWSVFVEQVFGGFWLSVFGLAAVIAIILVLGGLSAFTIIYYELFYFFAMIVGYGYNVITIPLFAVIMSWAIYQLMKFINSPNY